MCKPVALLVTFLCNMTGRIPCNVTGRVAGCIAIFHVCISGRVAPLAPPAPLAANPHFYTTLDPPLLSIRPLYILHSTI